MLLLLVGAALATTVAEVPNPRHGGGWVTDEAQVIPADTEARIEQILERLHSDLGAEVVLVSLAHADQPSKPFATELFNTWKIGDRKANNGLLALLVLDEHRIEMETGYGLEGILPDGWLGQMQSERMVPPMKRGDYGAGLLAGIEAIDERMRQSPDEVRLGTDGAIHVGAPQATGGTNAGWLALGGGAGLAALAGVGAVQLRRRRDRTCPHCGVWMPMMSESEEDAHLDAGQQKEEGVGAVDWQVHRCATCGETRTFERVRWFSGYSRCPSCRRRTRRTSNETEVIATEFHGGRVRVTEKCANCDYSSVHVRHTPRRPVVVTTGGFGGGGFGGGGGGGGGGGFGGGSSGGGGAGSSF